MTGENVLIGLSGGINSMAVLCWLVDSGYKPKELHLYYAHFYEHSPDTFQFVADGIRYARKHFPDVRVKITKHSVIRFFRDKKMIPHPTVSPCSLKLKIEPIFKYCFDNRISIDLIGYVKEELKRRSDKQYQPQMTLFDAIKKYPIGDFSNEWCFEYVQKHLGWYPEIYDIRWTEQDYKDGLCSKRQVGERVFKHNNCLPCKNMYPDGIEAVGKFFPKYHVKAMQLSAELSSYWGRDEAEFYTRFGRYLGQDETCENCKF